MYQFTVWIKHPLTLLRVLFGKGVQNNLHLGTVSFTATIKLQLTVSCLTLNISLLQLPASRLSCKYAKLYP